MFLALWPDPAVRAHIAAHALRWVWPLGCARYAPADWHVTLHFLGSVPAEHVPDIAAGVAVPWEPCDLVLDRPQCWPRGLAVLGATTVAPGLLALHDRLAQALRGLAQPVDARPWQPHLTLARRAQAATPPDRCAPLMWPVRGYALVASTGRADQRYQVLRHYPWPVLAAPAAHTARP